MTPRQWLASIYVAAFVAAVLAWGDPPSPPPMQPPYFT